MPIISTIQNKGKNGDAVLPGLELLKVLGLDEEKEEVRNSKSFSVTLSAYTFDVHRVLLCENGDVRFHKDLRIIKNELVSPKMVGDDVFLDFVFWRDKLVCIVPVLLRENMDGRPFSLLLKLYELKYYDFSDLWFDVMEIQPNRIDGGACVHPDVLKGVEAIKAGILLYLASLYGENVSNIQKVPNTIFVYESIRQGFHYYQPFYLTELLSHLEDGRSKGRSMEGRVYVSLPSAYVPGKFIDMEYYNAILGEEFRLEWDDSLFVVGYGTGIDLIHAARKCGEVCGVEVNPFSVASARTNLSVSGVESNVTLLWEDIRDYLVREKDSFMLGEKERMNKLLWNMPYESATKKPNPILLHDFFDNYSVLDWFLPLVADSMKFRGQLDVLLWYLSTDEKLFREQAKKHGFHVHSDQEKNIVMLRRVQTNPR